MSMFWSNPTVFSNWNIVFHVPKEFDDPQVSDGLEVISNESMDLKDLKESDDAQVFPHLRWACFNPPVLGMFQFFPASLASLLLPFRQSFDNVTPKLQIRDIGESFYSTRSTRSPKKSLPGNITLLLLTLKVMLLGNNFFSVNNNEKDRRTWQKLCKNFPQMKSTSIYFKTSFEKSQQLFAHWQLFLSCHIMQD